FPADPHPCRHGSVPRRDHQLVCPHHRLHQLQDEGYVAEPLSDRPPDVGRRAAQQPSQIQRTRQLRGEEIRIRPALPDHPGARLGEGGRVAQDGGITLQAAGVGRLPFRIRYGMADMALARTSVRTSKFRLPHDWSDATNAMKKILTASRIIVACMWPRPRSISK